MLGGGGRNSSSVAQKEHMGDQASKACSIQWNPRGLSTDNCMNCGLWESISFCDFKPKIWHFFLNPVINFVNSCYPKFDFMFKWYRERHVFKIYLTFAFSLAIWFCLKIEEICWGFFLHIYASIYLQSSMCAKF